MTEKISIAICMGSSCFARGNNTLLESLEDLIESRGWADRVLLSGLRCENRCNEGPNLKIDGVLHQAPDEGALLDLLEQKLGTDSAGTRSSIRKTADRKGD